MEECDLSRCQNLCSLEPPASSRRDPQEAAALNSTERDEQFWKPREATFARNPCIHAGPDNPVVGNNAAWDWTKSMEKPVISTVFLGFLPILTRKYLFLPGFSGFWVIWSREKSGLSAVASC
jgi:hypothetical protein